jgi:hypothetical protein
MRPTQEDGELFDNSEPSVQRLDLLVKAGFAKFGNKGDLKFGNEWCTRKLDEWLRGILPEAFEKIDATIETEDGYAWRLLKASRARLHFHRETPDGYDFVQAKGGKSKGWQESKLFLGMWISLTSIPRFAFNARTLVTKVAIPGIMQSVKGKGKAKRSLGRWK